ncbi:uncharacterized protein Cadr_000010141 [Camelus dromedarius]|uniref:DUF4549 domain-containing protein n=1 Tax=Camelus dromedarius TaxID=9838 RepID=A0A5N4DWN3_CAMDR|nr:uncharacterized protein Cadr_000010141 [Camelus dromedarius]
METMDEIYKIACTEKIQLLEKELAVQLTELKSEIEEQGTLQRAAHPAYSSIRMPKDISYFRRERELALKKTLQVAESKPLVIQADVMQRELESCLRREYTPENLPLLLLQALQYLPISKVLSVAVNKAPEVVQENEKVPVDDTDPDIHGSASLGSVNTSISGPARTEAAFVLPQHITKTEELKPQLRLLLSHFNIPYDVEELGDADKEIELLFLVSQKFQSIFKEQQRMQTFPDYDAGIAKVNLGLAGPVMALKKRANWISFIKVRRSMIKPKCDPWQKKLLTKLKERRRIDVLMHLQAKILKVKKNPCSLVDKILFEGEETGSREEGKWVKAESAQVSLNKISAPRILDSLPVDADEVLVLISEGHHHKSNENMKEDDPSVEGNENDPAQINLSQCADEPVKQKRETGYSCAVALQLLGLDDLPGPGGGDPVLARGTYLSFLYLRHLRIRELQRICLGILNYFRSIERTLTINTSGLTLVAGSLVPTTEDSSWVNTVKGGMGTSQGLGAHHYVHGTSAEHKAQSVQFMEFSEVENQDDYYCMVAGCVHTQDQQGVYVVYDEALSDLKELETELLLLASHYIEKEKGHKVGINSNTGHDCGWAHAGVDRCAVLYDMWTWEATLLENKRQLLDSYFEAYQHALDPEERFALAQVITDIMHRCARFDLSQPYFIKAYRDECACLRLHLQLVRGLLNQHIECQREYVRRLWQDSHPDDSTTFGLPLNIICKQLISINNSCPALKNIYLLEFHPSLGLASCISRALEHLLREARHTCRPRSASALTSLERHVLQLALDVWLTPAKPESWYSTQLQKDLFSAKVMGDPFLVGEIGLLALKSAADEGQNQGQDSHMLLLETFSKLLELLTLRHRLVEMSLESAHLARLYKELACEVGFEEFHLYLRPVHFEFASHKDKVVHPPPVFITSLLEDSDRVDRYSPVTLVLAISEVDDNQVGRFSFYTKEAILKLLSHSGVENLQVTLACQATQKNALMVAVQQASFYHTPQGDCPADVKVSL